MKKATLYFFSSRTCRFCGPAEKCVDELMKQRKDFELVKVTLGSPGSHEMFRRFEVSTTPTFIIQGEGYPENIGLKGNQGKKALSKYLDIAMGKQKLEEQAGLFDSVKKWFGK